MTELIYLQKTDGIAQLILHKPARRNALCLAMWHAIPQLITEAVRDHSVSVLIIHGGDAGAFAAGADISEFAEIYATPERSAETSAILAAAVQASEDCPKPTIASIEGACVGGGVSVAAACDLRFAGHGSKFGLTPGKLGLLYSPADTRRLMSVVGATNAKDLLFSGRIIDHEDAVRMGFIDHLLPAGGALNAAKAWADQVSKTAQSSVRSSKAMIRGLNEGWSDDTPEAMDLFLQALGGEDFQEGYKAFLEKRAPQFPGNAVSQPGGQDG